MLLKRFNDLSIDFIAGNYCFAILDNIPDTYNFYSIYEYYSRTYDSNSHIKTFSDITVKYSHIMLPKIGTGFKYKDINNFVNLTKSSKLW